MNNVRDITKAELNEIVEIIIRVRDVYDLTLKERDALADAANIVYYNIDELSKVKE